MFQKFWSQKTLKTFKSSSDVTAWLGSTQPAWSGSGPVQVPIQVRFRSSSGSGSDLVQSAVFDVLMSNCTLKDPVMPPAGRMLN